MARKGDELDGCDLDFTETLTDDEELEDLLEPEDDEDAA